VKLAIWLLWAALALLWTGGAWLAAELAQWSAQAIASGGAESAARAATQWPVPPWMALWVDPEWLKSVQEFMRWVLDAGSGLMPFVGSAVGWLVPLVWLTWGGGLLLLLVLAAAAHWGVGRLRPSMVRPAAASAR